VSGSSDQTLSFVVQFKNEASSALNDLQSQIQQLSQNVGKLRKQHTTATAAISGHTSAVKEHAAELQEAGYIARALFESHSQLAEKLNQGARALGGLGSILAEISPVASE
jgi:predicted  nucleic acid-binding Zn-ribbon protein